MKRRRLALACVLWACVALPMNAARAAPAQSCEGSGRLSYVCGPVNVEDMVRAPGTRWLIGSSMHVGRNIPRGGPGLYLIDSEAKTARPAAIVLGPEPKDGPFAGCPAPDLTILATHGLELRAGTGGRHTLYAVNHGGRETIEVFQVDARSGPPTLTWTGCLILPANTWENSIAALPGGGLAMSKYAALDKLDAAPVLRGEITGTVYIWKPGAGFSELAGAQLSGNNGLLASADGKWLWVNDQGRGQIVRFALDGSQPPTYAKVAFLPDNLRWAPDGTIVAAGQIMSAGDSLAQAHGWGVARLDPQTMAVTPMMTEPGRPEFSNGTVALQVGKTLWIGTFRGDRIAYVQIP
jgi:hypothetical protein